VLNVALTLYRGSDGTLKLTGLSVAETGAYLNAATVTYAIKDPATGDTVSGGSGTMSYVAASNGNYTVEIDAAVTVLMTADRYRVDVTAIEGSYKDVRRIRIDVQDRGEV
jgi:hypothetical protein